MKNKLTLLFSVASVLLLCCAAGCSSEETPAATTTPETAAPGTPAAPKAGSNMDMQGDVAKPGQDTSMKGGR